MRALILDDEPAIGRVICRIAQASGLNAEAVLTATEFQLHYRLALPDIVLLDLQLRDEDGVVQLRFLAEQGYANPIILMSGHDRRVLSAAERLGRDLGLNILATITKPFGPEDLRPLFDQLTAGASPPSIEQSC